MNSVEDVHDVHAWSLDGKYHVLSLHLVISLIPDQETQVQLKNQIREQTRKMGIDHATIEIELPSEPCVLEIVDDSSQHVAFSWWSSLKNM